MKVEKPVIGALCQSLKGRDKGVYFMIYKVEENGMVYIVDGNYRKLSNPKLKKVKHLHLCPEVFSVIAEKVASGKQVFDNEIYSALKPYNNGYVEIK